MAAEVVCPGSLLDVYVFDLRCSLRFQNVLFHLRHFFLVVLPLALPYVLDVVE